MGDGVDRMTEGAVLEVGGRGCREPGPGRVLERPDGGDGSGEESGANAAERLGEGGSRINRLGEKRGEGGSVAASLVEEALGLAARERVEAALGDTERRDDSGREGDAKVGSDLVDELDGDKEGDEGSRSVLLGVLGEEEFHRRVEGSRAERGHVGGDEFDDGRVGPESLLHRGSLLGRSERSGDPVDPRVLDDLAVLEGPRCREVFLRARLAAQEVAPQDALDDGVLLLRVRLDEGAGDVRENDVEDRDVELRGREDADERVEDLVRAQRLVKALEGLGLEDDLGDLDNGLGEPGE